MNVNFRIIPHAEQRYPTVGDWFFNDSGTVLNINVSRMSTWKYEFLVFQHEYTEAMLCYNRGIKEEDVTKFDKKFERERERKKWTNEEPGDDPRAPYRKEHFFATNLERQIALELGINWKEYDEEICSL